MANKPIRADAAAGIASGVIGLVLIVLIWVNLVFPAPIASGGGTVLTGSDIALKEHEWGFNQFAKGGPQICATTNSTTITITLSNTGVNLHGFQIVRADTGAFVAGLAKTDLLKPGEPPRKIVIDIGKIAPGSYDYICPVSGHRQKGMVAPFVVQSSC
jgi:FtsP/CotA-like multicopper oxidase with cupredoxin domain